MNENDKIKDFVLQVENTRQLVDRINRAMYGMTWEEHTRIMGKEEEDDA